MRTARSAGVRDLDRVVEEELDTVAFEEADGRLEALHQAADRAVELAEDAHQLLGLDRVDEVRPAAQVGEEHRDLPPVAAKDRLVAGGDDRVGELRRQEPLQPSQPLQLGDLRLHALLERPVQLGELSRLRLDRVVVALDPEQRPHAGEQLVVVEGLRDEVVGTGLDRLRLLLADARRDHDHRQHGGVVVRAEVGADGIAVEAGHHHVEEDQVGLLPPRRARAPRTPSLAVTTS